MTNNRQSHPHGILRVLHITGHLRRGGVETWLSQALVRLPRERYQCDVCNYRFEGGDYSAVLEQYGCGLHFVPHGFSPLVLFRFSKQFRRLLREGQYDVVHCHGLLLVGFILFLAWLEKVPIRIGHSHNTDRRTSGAVAPVLSRVALAVNRLLARALSTHGVGCSAEAQVALFGARWQESPKYSIIHCGIDLAPFEPDAVLASCREDLGIPAGTKVIGHVSNFSLQKNTLFLIEVAAAVFRLRRNIVLLCVGDGVTRVHAEQRCRDLGIQSRVIFAGIRPDVPAVMRSAMDIFVMPSLCEGLGIVLLEAQAAGLPCLASDAVTREAQVGDGAIEFLPLAVGPDAWASKVVSQLESTTPRHNPLRIMKDSDFNVVISARSLADLYDAASAQHAASTR